MLSRIVRRPISNTAMALACLISSVAASPMALAQDTGVEQYQATLEEITNRQMTLRQREFYLRQQQAQIEALEADVAEAQAVEPRELLLPIVRNMVAEIEKVMVADLPIRVERRFALLDDLRSDLQSDDVAIGDAYRRAMELYGLEVAMGLQVGAYTGLNPVEPGTRYAACLEDVDSAKCALSDELRQALETGAELDDLRDEIYDGNYLHFGRMALMFLERDYSVGYRYNEETESWDVLPGSALLGLRQNVRIANGDSAISTMTAPIRVGSSAADAS